MTSGYVEGVLDLTFHEVSDESSLTTQIGNKVMFLTQTLVPSSPSKSRSSSPTPETYGDTMGSTSPKSKFRKKNIHAIRLGNNEVQSTSILTAIPAHFDTSRILWLDLSFNMIVDIFSDFPKVFPQVTTIYLHANRISRLSHVKTLGELEHLKSLSLYGNPIEEKKHYRNYTIFYCKNLHQFDKSPVTKTQLQQVNSHCNLDFSFSLLIIFSIVGASLGSNLQKKVESFRGR